MEFKMKLLAETGLLPGRPVTPGAVSQAGDASLVSEREESSFTSTLLKSQQESLFFYAPQATRHQIPG